MPLPLLILLTSQQCWVKRDILGNSFWQMLACQPSILKPNNTITLEDADKCAYGQLYRARKNSVSGNLLWGTHLCLYF